MTSNDYNKLNQSKRTILSSTLFELREIKKENLKLSERLRIERAIASIECVRILLDTKFD